MVSDRDGLIRELVKPTVVTTIQQDACHVPLDTPRPLALPPPTLIAPRWHTALFVLLVIGVAAAGTLAASSSGAVPRGSPASGPPWVAFLPLLFVEGMLVFWVARVARPRSVLSELIGVRPDSRRAIGDLRWALGAALVIVGIELAWKTAFGATRAPSVAAMLPHTAAERIGWVAVAATVGFCEEVIYRGYLQAQLHAFTRSAAVAIVGSAVIFGVAHLEQGPAAALRIAFAGAVLGVVARKRSSLVPGILCHAGIDAAAGLFA